VSHDIELRQGTLDLLVLRALHSGEQHGYAILAWLRRVTKGRLRLEDAALYPALHRLEARGLIGAEWGLSDHNRRAKYYRLTARGQRALKREAARWSEYVALVDRVLEAEEPA
jgi:transcriptional regulator